MTERGPGLAGSSPLKAPARVLALAAVSSGVAARAGLDMFVARLAGPVPFAGYALVSATAAIAAGLILVGLPGIANQVVPALQADGANLTRLRSFERLGTLLSLLGGTLLGALLCILVLSVPAFGYAADLAYLLLILTPATAWLVWERQLGLLTPRPLHALFSTTYVAVLALVGAAFASATPVVARYIVAVAAASLLVALWVRRNYYRSIIGPDSDGQPGGSWPAWLRAGMVLLSANAATMLTLQADVILIAFYANDAAAGAYSLASRLSLAVTLGLAAVIARDAPIMGRHHAAGDASALWSSYRKARRSSIVLTLVPGLMLAGASARLLTFFGTDFVQAAPWLIILILARLASGSTGPIAELLVITGHTRTVAVAAWVGLATTLVAIALLGPIWGPYGVAVGTLLGTVASNGIQLLVGRKLRTSL